MSLEMDNIVCGGCSARQLTQFRRYRSFKKIKTIFRLLKLEIALAIPVSNDEKYSCNNSAGQYGQELLLRATYEELIQYKSNIRLKNIVKQH